MKLTFLHKGLLVAVFALMTTCLQAQITMFSVNSNEHNLCSMHNLKCNDRHFAWKNFDESIPLPGTYLKKRGQKLAILSACLITTGFAGFILANNIIPPDAYSTNPFCEDTRAKVQVLSTFLIAGGIALSIPAIHIWHKGQKRMNKSKLNSIN